MGHKQLNWVRDVGARIVEARVRRGHTQDQAADYLRASRWTLSRWERSVALPSFWFRPRLEDYCGEPLTTQPTGEVTRD